MTKLPLLLISGLICDASVWSYQINNLSNLKATIAKENKEILLQLLLQSGKTTGFLLCEQARWWNTLTVKELGIISLGLSKNPLPQEINQNILSFIAVDKVEKKSLKPFLPLLKNNINKNFHKEAQHWFSEYIKNLIDLCVYYYRINFQFDVGHEYSKEQIRILKENLKIELRKLDYCKFFNHKFKNILTHQFMEAGQKQIIFNRAELLLLFKRAQEIYTSQSRTQNGLFNKRKIESVALREGSENAIGRFISNKYQSDTELENSFFSSKHRRK